ncbi:MAG: hypothetical protein J6I73_01660 [Treponema sp.]|nr:hypothetical protein [Treponema sp.]
MYEFSVKKTGECFYPEFTEDICSLKSAFIHKSDFDKATVLNWSNLGNHHESSSFVESEKYISCDTLFKDYYDIDGIFPVLVQQLGHGLPEIWSLHQDIVIALRLYREGDIWICPDEDYTEVAHLLRDEKGVPRKIEIKNEFLKDYLCALNMGLVLTWYQDHEKYASSKPNFGWANEHETIPLKNGHWEGRIFETTTTGNQLGNGAFVMHVSRNDIDKDDDVPVMEPPNDDNISGESKVVSLKTGETVFRVSGEIWNSELILPGTFSTRVRGDEPQNYPFFKIDASGTIKTAKQLEDDGRWLWFTPEVTNALLERKDGCLKWYTRETGRVSCSYGYFIHFGINEKGLITVYAEDIASLPLWQQIIWAGYNVAPDGGVSKELLMSQVDAEPASTQAAEEFLPIEYNRLNELFQNSFDTYLFRKQKEIDSLLPKVHRFRSLSEDGFYNLAKDLARLTVDAICAKEIQKLLTIPAGEKWGSLKTLQNFLIQKFSVEESKAKQIMASLFGIYDMRQVDAHLGDALKDDPYVSLGVLRELAPLFRGQKMLERFVTTLCVIQKVIKGE